jgi:2-polyprenyl-3-methyl-5-hydroxy-6-metoxy-1,4-benzoquinol methylase
MNLKYRSYKEELLDEDDIPADELRKNLLELNFINTWLGGHAITISGLKHFLNSKDEITVCELGCGGGDNISALNNWCKKRGINANFIGIDIKPTCIEFAQSNITDNNISWIVSDYLKVQFQSKPDIIFSSLFCHHFNEEQLKSQLSWMKENSIKGFFINDLHRNKIAYNLIKWLTKFFSKSYLVKHDAPLSVARGFKEKEWRDLFVAAKINHYKIQWKWAFRYLIVYKHE